jgi:hypothetical protein
MSRSRFSAHERALRSKLAKLVHDEPILRGTLSTRRITCGKPNCRCAKGHKHLCLYLTCSRHGRVEQLFIPKDLEEKVRRWVQTYHTVRELLEELSEASWHDLRTQKARRP